MTQNIYDDPAFFAGYNQLPRSVGGLANAPEWGALRAVLPDVRGLRVVDLGCGFGWFCRWAADEGAARVVGFDVSENMLARARAETTHKTVAYERADLEQLDLPERAFDLAYSSLALHYIEDVGRILAVVHRALVPGSRFVFSIEHPIYMAPQQPGWVTDQHGRRTWPLESYFVEGARRTNWLADGVIKQHRTMGTTLNLLIRTGFQIAHVEEWRPSDAQIAAHPEWAEELDRPMFLLIAADR